MTDPTKSSTTAKLGAFFLALLSGVFFFLKFFKPSNAPSAPAPFPGEADKKAVESDVAKTEKEIEKVDGTSYTDEQIKDRFN